MAPSPSKFYSKIIAIVVCMVTLHTAAKAQNDVRASIDSCIYFEARQGQADSILLFPDVEAPPLKGRLIHLEDLNSDGRKDLILNMGIKGPQKDSLYAIYIDQGNGLFKCVLNPTALADWSMTANEYNQEAGGLWKKIRLLKKQTDTLGQLNTYIYAYLLFDGGSYKVFNIAPLMPVEDTLEQKRAYQVHKEYEYMGSRYQVGQLHLKGEGLSNPLSLRVRSDQSRIIDFLAAPLDQTEIGKVKLSADQTRPYFLVEEHYHLLVMDLLDCQLSGWMKPGENVPYAEDGMSGTISGSRLSEDGKYVFGAAVNYGVFCYALLDWHSPRELKRYSSRREDQGQPYFFLEQNKDGTYNGLIAHSDLIGVEAKKSKLFRTVREVRSLFTHAALRLQEAPYADPADYEKGRVESYVYMEAKAKNGASIPWVVDLKSGQLLTGEAAILYLAAVKRG